MIHLPSASVIKGFLDSQAQSYEGIKNISLSRFESEDYHIITVMLAGWLAAWLGGWLVCWLPCSESLLAWPNIADLHGWLMMLNDG